MIRPATCSACTTTPRTESARRRLIQQTTPPPQCQVGLGEDRVDDDADHQDHDDDRADRGEIEVLLVCVELLAQRDLSDDGDEQLGRPSGCARRTPSPASGPPRTPAATRAGSGSGTARTRAGPWSCPPAAAAAGCSPRPLISPLAIDGAAPRMTTNRIAELFSPNKTIANGAQATEGIVCSPVMIDPTAARSGGMRATSSADDRADDQRDHVTDDGAAQRPADGGPQHAVLHLLPQVGEAPGRGP